MQDALGRESGRLPNLTGICWLIAWFWLTRYPVVLCKQDNIDGKSGRAWTPFGALSLCFSSSGCSDLKRKKRKEEKFAPLEWTSIAALPSSLKSLQPLKVLKCNYPFFLFFFFTSAAFTQSVMCLSLFEKVQTFSPQALCKVSGKF